MKRSIIKLVTIGAFLLLTTFAFAQTSTSVSKKQSLHLAQTKTTKSLSQHPLKIAKNAHYCDET